MTERKKTPAEPGVNPDYPFLTAVPGAVSILGDHDGILDDDLFDILEEKARTLDSIPPHQSS